MSWSPSFLRYGSMPRERSRYEELAEIGQTPRIMVIGCCDSRVAPEVIFDARPGEMFVVRNVANLIPPFSPDDQHHGTSAAVEYAVTALKVAQLIVLGHSQCGGVQGCIAMCRGEAPGLEARTSFVGRWMDILRPGYERVVTLPAEDQIRALERQAVVISLENLMTFPFVKTAVELGELSLHGVLHDIAQGALEQYDGKTQGFSLVS